MLLSNPDWEQPLPPEIQALGAPRLAVWMQVHAYLLAVADVTDLRVWADGKDWFGRWMPETPDMHNVLLGAHPHDPGWSAADGGVDWWEAQAGGAKQSIKERSQKELAVLKAQRELALYNLKLLEGASATAWTEVRKGADDAWARMQSALAEARTHFEKRP